MTHGRTRPGSVAGLDLDRARAIAVEIAEEAGELLCGRSRPAPIVRAKGTNGDVVTDLDEDAEQLIVGRLRGVYPHHRIVAEESGLCGGGDRRWTWLIDPLDGTNNVAIGLPAYVVGLALCRDGVPLVGVVHEPLSGATWSAIRGRGAQGPGVGRERTPRRVPALGWTQGYPVGRHDPVARSIRLVLEANAQRLLQLWAPLLCWVMLARGDIDGIVGYRPEAIDLPAGALIAREAGMELRALDGGPFDDTVDEPGDRRDQSFVAGSSQTVNWLVTLVKEAVRVEPALTRLWHGEQLLRPSTAPPGHNGHEPG